MSDAVRRAIRTFFQLVAAGGLTALVTQLSDDVPARYAPYILIGFAILTSFAQNWLEDNAGLPAVLKATPSAGQNPVTRDPAV